MREVLVNRLGGLSLPRKSVVRLTDRPDMTLDVYRGRKTTIQQQQQQRTEFHSSSIRTNRAIILRSNSIRSMTCFPPESVTLLWWSLITEEENIQSYKQCGLIFAPLRLEAYPTDGKTHGQTLRKHNTSSLSVAG